jgi:hypothetical protein
MSQDGSFAGTKMVLRRLSPTVEGEACYSGMLVESLTVRVGRMRLSWR